LPRGVTWYSAPENRSATLRPFRDARRSSCKKQDTTPRRPLALNISTDALIFDDTERGPDETLRMQFEAIRQFDPDERKIAEGVLESLINNHQAKRLFATRSAAPVATAPNLRPSGGKRAGGQR
jgi:hypothetical protein